MLEIHFRMMGQNGRNAIFTLVGLLGCSLSAAHAEPSSKVYYCVGEDGIGFDFKKERQKYEPARFAPRRFTLQWNGAVKTITVADPFLPSPLNFTCTPGLIHSCFDGAGYMISFNPKTMEFIYAKGWGHLTGNENKDTISIQHGKCSAF
jgi:hypothetical protein